MKKTMKAVVIGTGVISEQHLAFLRDDARVELAGVCDLSPIAGRYAAERFEAAASYTDYAAMLDQTRPDVVHVLTPPQTHVRLAGDCLRAGAHVICEKPIAPTHDGLLELLDVAKQSGRRLIENHNYRFNPQVLEIEHAVAQGKLGKVHEVEARMTLGIRAGGRYADANLPHPSHKLPAGVIHEFLSHLVYLAQRFQATPEDGYDRVAAAWSNHGGVDNPADAFQYDDLDALVIAGDCHARLRFSCHNGPDGFELNVRGSKGQMTAELFNRPRVSAELSRGGQLAAILNQVGGGLRMMQSGVQSFTGKVMQRTAYEGLAVFLQQSYDALCDGTESPVSEPDMLRASGLIASLLEEGVRV